MLESAKRLISPSGRSDVPPFMVMDVMAAAARIEAAGGKVIHMEVGQPAFGAPTTAVAAVQAVLGKSALGYTESLGIPSLRASMTFASLTVVANVIGLSSLIRLMNSNL